MKVQVDGLRKVIIGIIKEEQIKEDRLSDAEYDVKKDKIIVYLKGKHSEKYTKYAMAFDALDKAEKKVEELKPELRQLIPELFDAAEEASTLVVDTISAAFTLSKKSEDTTKSETDYEKAWNMLYALVKSENEGLIKKMEEFAALATEIKTVKARERGVSGKVKKEGMANMLPLKEDIGTWLGSLADKFKAFLNKFNPWAKKYKQNLNTVNKLIEKI